MYLSFRDEFKFISDYSIKDSTFVGFIYLLISSLVYLVDRFLLVEGCNIIPS